MTIPLSEAQSTGLTDTKRIGRFMSYVIPLLGVCVIGRSLVICNVVFKFTISSSIDRFMGSCFDGN